MSPNRLQRMSEERRDRLFLSAAEEFETQGYDTASLNRILERAGIGKSSLYYYFDDKRDLFGQLLRAVVERFMRHIGGFDSRTLTVESFWPEIEWLFLKGVDFFEDHAWSVRVGQLFYRLRAQEKGGGTTGSALSVAEAWVADLLRRGMTLGVVRTDLPEALLVPSVMALVEVCDRYSIEHWRDYGPIERRALVAQQMELLKRLCLPAAA